MLEFLKAISKPLIEVYDLFTAFRNNNIKILSFSSQVISLEYALNDRFNPGNDEIYILDYLQFSDLYLYNKVEDRNDKYFFNKAEAKQYYYLRNKTEYSGDFDFVVMVPTWLTYDINEMRSLINRYKLAGKRYTIVNY
jgi:hypothetical protein